METRQACQFCAQPMPQAACRCPACGVAVRRYKSRRIAAVLALTGGALGIHRFYLGQWWGLCYLLLFWTGLPFLVGFIEACVFFFTPETSWKARYNRYSTAGRVGVGTRVLVVASFCVIPALLAGFILLMLHFLAGLYIPS